MKYVLVVMVLFGFLLVIVSCSDEGGPAGSGASDDPLLVVTPTNLDFGTEETSLTVIISNGREGEFSWTIDENETWIECSDNSGIISDMEEEINVTVDRDELYSNDYSGSIRIETDIGHIQVVQVSMTVPQRDPIQFWSLDGFVLEEDQYTFNLLTYTVPRDGEVEVYVDLDSWPGHYGLEVMIMYYSDYVNYASGDYFIAWHRSMFSEGTYTLNSDPLEEGDRIKVIVDNTNWGWEDTDFDFVDDTAYFDVEAEFHPY